MKSKELKERLATIPNKRNLYCFDEEQVKELIKDLEKLEILRNNIMIIENKQMTFGYGKYYISIRPDVILSDDAIKIIKEWLDGN